ncbi:MAG: XylR family transcriptional regulator [Phycisphaerae bacterium]
MASIDSTAADSGSSRKVVGLLIESSRVYGRGLLRGIAKFIRIHDNWSVLYQERVLGDRIPAWLQKVRCDGIIARIETSEELEFIRRRRIPAVDLRGIHPAAKIPRILNDEQNVAELAAEHLRSRGFHNFAFCGFSGADYSEHLRDYFIGAIGASERKVAVFEGDKARSGMRVAAIEAESLLHEKELEGWLAGLPKPVGIMACNDIRGRQVLNACHCCGIWVPDQTAVIGFDNDEVLCELANPPLSSVAPATERIGYLAAEMLAGMMTGKYPEKQEILVPPIGVITRRSTDVLAIADPALVAALRFIRDKSGRGINVESILDHIAATVKPVSRSWLEHRFMEILKHTPKDEIMNVRIAGIETLLLETTWSLEKIAEKVGLQSAAQLSTLFRRRTGHTPGDFRKNARPH